MSTGLKVTPGGDLVLDNKKQPKTISGTEKALQDIAIILRSLKGTFHLNADFGLDHIAIIESERNILVAKSEIQKALAQYPDLTKSDVTCTFDELRQLQVTVSGTLKTGEEIFLEETL